MPSTLITNIKLLAGARPDSPLLRGGSLADLPCKQDAYLLIEDEHIVDYGEMKDCHFAKPSNIIDASAQTIFPGWCDSHTHLVFAGSREQELLDKINGLSYGEIAAKGGGILNSAEVLNKVSEDELFKGASTRLAEISRLGTAAVEIKSGYALTVEGELKMLRVIKKLKEKSNLIIKATFLGAHAFPLRFKNDHEGYINEIINDMLPVIAREKLADFIDVFCEQGFFSPEETAKICEAGIRHGLKSKLHVNQLNSIGGIETGISQKALTLDHLETLTDNDLQRLKYDSLTGINNKNAFQGICTLLPTAAFFLGIPFPPVRQLIAGGAAIALASDFNPGSSPSGNMNLVISMACIRMKMLPQEAINAATLNGAHAMEVAGETGSITVGKKANLIFTKPIPSLAYFPYAFGSSLVDKVMINGAFI
jgi:imidazolonepropionase